MLDAVALATGAAYAAVVDADGHRLAEYGGHRGPTFDVALRHNGVDLGCSGSVLGAASPGSPTATAGWWRPWRRTSRWWSPPSA